MGAYLAGMLHFDDLPLPPVHAPVERFAFEEIDGTNAFAGRWLRLAGGASEAAILSRRQSAGRGQHGREWHTEAGLDLAWSYARRFGAAVEPVDLVRLNMAWAAAVLGAVEAGAAGAELGLKWPNDVYGRVGGRWRKLGGLLVEAQWRGAGCVGVVLGVGVNVGSRRLGAAEGVSLAELGGELGVEGLARLLERGVRATWGQIPAGIATYHDRLLFVGEERPFVVRGQQRTGRFLSARPDGSGRFDFGAGPEDLPQGDVTWVWPENQG